MSSTLEQLEGTCEGIRAELEAFDSGDAPTCAACGGECSYGSCDDCGEDAPEDSDVFAYCQDALEAYATARVSYGSNTIESVTVVFGTGGPHVEGVCRMDGAGSFTVEGYWGSDRVSRHGTSQAFEAWCEDYVSGLSYGWGE